MRTIFTPKSFQIFILSFVALFIELAVIRWLSSEIRIFAYFKNLPLIAAFLGFGIGFYLHQSGLKYFKWFPRLFFVLTVLICFAQYLGLTHVIFVDPREFVIFGAGFGDHIVDSAPGIFSTLKAVIVIVGIFFLVVFCFATLTVRLGAAMNEIESLSSYTANVAGSLAGIISFSLAAFLELSPYMWILPIFLCVPYFMESERQMAKIYFTAILLITVFTTSIAANVTWSPYYKVDVQRFAQWKQVYRIAVNSDGFQAIQNLSEDFLQQYSNEDQAYLRRHYNIPYELANKPLQRVLILGGGTGNDAAAALRHRAEHIDVVEIDPAIVRIGHLLHPEHPYGDPRVTVHVTDARAFLQKTRKTYDLIVFGTLDSHAAFSSLSSLRMDNYVFTEESLIRARELLNPGGGISINYFAINDWLSQRHFDMLSQAGKYSVLSYKSTSNQEILLMSGQLFDESLPLGATNYVRTDYKHIPGKVTPTTDDWPFLFLEKPGIPFHYLMPMGFILIGSFFMMKRIGLSLSGMNWHMFFMGAAFLLLQTKAVVSLALVFGSTWHVNSIVIGSILFAIILANIVISAGFNPGFRLLHILLFGVLLFNFFFNIDVMNTLPQLGKILASALIIGAPMFFASLIFAKAFKLTQVASVALASNLFGALVGGFIEYLDMLTGLRWLYIFALVLYAVSAVFLARQLRTVDHKTA
ncbi:MAG: hypothetical protein AAF649_02175 [Verrucomicrobiota bacterium]